MDAKTATERIWRYRGGSFTLGERTLLMGVVNVTPDSFSDGGRFLSQDAAVEHALRLQSEGADLLDFGAESTRPGSDPVADDEQLRRLLPVLEGVTHRLHIPISVDTTSAVVAHACLEAGAAIVNDISGFHFDAQLPGICKNHDAGVVLMHIKASPKTMQRDPHYENLFGEILGYLREGIQAAEDAGISDEQILVDPGLGFGKTFEQNYRLLGGLEQFRDLAAGVLAGPSRKGFTGEFSQRPANQRQYSTAAAVAIAALHGADVIRVHDVAEMRQVTDIMDRFKAVQKHERVGTQDR